MKLTFLMWTILTSCLRRVVAEGLIEVWLLHLVLYPLSVIIKKMLKAATGVIRHLVSRAFAINLKILGAPKVYYNEFW